MSTAAFARWTIGRGAFGVHVAHYGKVMRFLNEKTHTMKIFLDTEIRM